MLAVPVGRDGTALLIPRDSGGRHRPGVEPPPRPHADRHRLLQRAGSVPSHQQDTFLSSMNMRDNINDRIIATWGAVLNHSEEMVQRKSCCPTNKFVKLNWLAEHELSPLFNVLFYFHLCRLPSK